jgi:hypothetical protein
LKPVSPLISRASAILSNMAPTSSFFIVRCLRP